MSESTSPPTPTPSSRPVPPKDALTTRACLMKNSASLAASDGGRGKASPPPVASIELSAFVQFWVVNGPGKHRTCFVAAAPMFPLACVYEESQHSSRKEWVAQACSFAVTVPQLFESKVGSHAAKKEGDDAVRVFVRECWPPTVSQVETLEKGFSWQAELGLDASPTPGGHVGVTFGGSTKRTTVNPDHAVINKSSWRSANVVWQFYAPKQGVFKVMEPVHSSISTFQPHFYAQFAFVSDDDDFTFELAMNVRFVSYGSKAQELIQEPGHLKAQHTWSYMLNAKADGSAVEQIAMAKDAQRGATSTEGEERLLSDIMAQQMDELVPNPSPPQSTFFGLSPGQLCVVSVVTMFSLYALYSGGSKAH